MRRFKDLEIWKLSRSFCSIIYETTYHFPESEKFGLTSQIRRASISIPSNITENKDFSRFLEIAIGSAYEIETQLLISHDLNLLNDDQLKSLLPMIDSIIKMISKFKFTLK